MENREMDYRNSLDRIIYKQGLRLSKSDKKWFEDLNPGFITTGDVIELWEDDVMGNNRKVISKIVFKGPFTPHMAIRDCGSYYIEAKYSRYIKLDKKTLKIIDYDCSDC